MAKQNKDYGYDIQKLYLEMMLANAETFVRCQSIFDFSLFDRKLQDTAQFINKYVTEYNTLPTYEMVNKSCNVDLKQTEQLTEEHFDWLLNDFETFVRHKSLERAILKSADMLEKGEYGPVEDLVKKAVQIGLHKDLGTDYFDDPKQRLMGLKNQNGQVSTGWTTLDKRLFGGFNKGELNIFAGAPRAGKSLFLANRACNWVLKGMNVAYITIDASINTPWTRGRIEHQKNKNDIEFAQPEDIAEEIFRISQQKRSAWSFDVELRPDIEKW